jgi:hypothetical protein
MRVKTFILVAVSIVTLFGCNKAPAPANNPQAAITLKDGSTFGGTVTKSSTSEISVQASTGETRTYPMSQVASVQYLTDPAPVPPEASPAGVPPPVTQQAPPPAAEQPPPPVALQAQPPVVAEQGPAPVPAPPPPPVVEYRTIPTGTTLSVRNNETIDSTTAQVGQTFSGVVNRDVMDTRGRLAIPHGSRATLIVRSATDQGKLQGQSDLAVDVESVTVNGRHYRLETRDYVEKGKQGVGTNKRTGTFVGGGAALGGIIGAIAGGGKGLAIGALSGAGAGVATQGLSRGKAVKIPAETVLNFQLEAPIRIHYIP